MDLRGLRGNLDEPDEWKHFVEWQLLVDGDYKFRRKPSRGGHSGRQDLDVDGFRFELDCPGLPWYRRIGRMGVSQFQRLRNPAFGFRVRWFWLCLRKSLARGLQVKGSSAGYRSFHALTSSCNAGLASMNIISVLSRTNRGLGIPENPGLRLRLITRTLPAWSTFKIGMP